jgi:hypothetical protein
MQFLTVFGYGRVMDTNQTDKPGTHDLFDESRDVTLPVDDETTLVNDSVLTEDELEEGEN